MDAFAKLSMSINPALFTENFVLTIPEGEQHRVSVKRYSFVGDDQRRECLTPAVEGATSSSVTLLLAHGLGLHKETWDPVMSDLHRIQHLAQSKIGVLISDAWSIDCPTHGDSALLNESKFKGSDRFNCCMDYSLAFIALLNCNHFSKRASKKRVFIGHSAGALATILAAAEYRRRWRFHPFSSLILVESPIIATPQSSAESSHDLWKMKAKAVIQLVYRRRDKWASEEDAHDWLSKRQPYSSWNKEALDSYVSHGLRNLPTLYYPNELAGVTLKCYRGHESEPYAKGDEPLHAANHLENLKGALPVHLIYAESSFFRPTDEEITLLSNLKESKFASVSIIPGADHFVVQDVPTETAIQIWKILSMEKYELFRSKL